MWNIIIIKTNEKLKLFKEKSLSLFCDNKTVINVIHNSVQYDQAKHTEINWHFIKEKVVDDSLCLYHVPSSE